jgi:RHH-type proline utilization regulon transcriptional repressor/proline dehydrogenase/delta 1-pyrroline-5-carboxylate dehydrogenase
MKLIERAIALAARLQKRANELQTPAERRQQMELDRMCQSPADKATLVQLTDQAFRSQRASRVAKQFTHILDVQGIPRFFSSLDRTMLRGFQTFGDWLPSVTVPLVKEHMRQETANVVLPAETQHLTTHLRARLKEGVRMNLNFLGEALVGEEEAAHRLDKYLAALQLPDVEVLSVKISTLFSQISPIAREKTVQVLCDRLELLYRAAAHLEFTRADGARVPKFVYLDMEEYRDLDLTAEAFMRTLNRPGLEKAESGIALQAYLPDSAAVQRRINTWARERVAHGGGAVTIRLVKGANMEMERAEASQRDWAQAPFKTKRETDANYKRMLHEAMRPENLAAVRLGVASHNLFDLSYALVLATEMQALDRVQFEMLEGMAGHQRRALLEECDNLLLYAPACRRDEFLNAIGYLIRRMDENTGEENFLRHAFKLVVGSDDWKVLENNFRESFLVEVSDEPRRKQNRATEDFSQPCDEMPIDHFENEADTDWSLPENGRWAETLIAQSEPETSAIPLVIDGKSIGLERASQRTCADPSHPAAVVASYVEASLEDVEIAIRCAREDSDGWRTMSVDARNEILGRVAAELRQARGKLLWAAMANCGKTLSEGDPELSEAVDFVEFYRSSAREVLEMETVAASGCGVVLVIPPWNFPIAIPCGGIAAALAAGNTVILKPSSDAVLVAWELCQCFWRAGVSRKSLQFVPCAGSGAGSVMAGHADIDAVILTGGTDTALRMLARKPDMRLFAETGGKNASIITALSDRELALKHVVHSAFSHAGQKCSATSLLLLEREVYEDANFKRMLIDAVRSIPCGSAWELHSRMGPMIRPPGGDLERAMKILEPGESWAVMPQQIGNNAALRSPGVKWGVSRGSFTHLTEFFGPVLAVIAFDTLDEAIDIVNDTGYGLTSGIHSLDEREISRWREGVHAGNLYINRSTVGAVVLRQPFGGMGRSCFGPGIKAGGPNYVAQLMRFEDRTPKPPEGAKPTNPALALLAEAITHADQAALNFRTPQLLAAFESYDISWKNEFSREHDHLRLLGQDNIRRYLPFDEVRVRVTATDSAFDFIARVAAARVTGARVIVSTPPGLDLAVVGWLEMATETWAAAIEFVQESDSALALHITESPDHAVERIRFASPVSVPTAVRQAASTRGIYLADESVLSEGRIELLWYLREQSISYDYHRYGNLGLRAAEMRKEPS